VIGAGRFAELARMMVEVDPTAAIHAFGAALQIVEVQGRVAGSKRKSAQGDPIGDRG
jgi:hypothetical protein